jgi:arylsulfatase A-like enzyme
MDMAKQPNIIFIMSDDHAAHAISAYGSRVNQTPNIDRLASGGALLRNCFCTNGICTPSRATILTGQYGHITGVTSWQALDNRRPVQVQKLLQQAGYQTAIIGKWHLGHGIANSVWSANQVREKAGAPVPCDPAGFDYFRVLIGQSEYSNPPFSTADGNEPSSGYVTDTITGYALDYLNGTSHGSMPGRDPGKPFMLMVHHKAPHRHWEPGPEEAHLFQKDLPVPETFWDDYAGRPAAAAAKMRVASDMVQADVKAEPPAGLQGRDRDLWYYQRYMKDYLRCVAGVDKSVGRILDWLDASGEAENTIVIYTSDQGFFLGDHGWYDKRLIYEEQLRMPLLIRYPREIQAGSTLDPMLLNHDFAPTLLDYAGAAVPPEMQGVSGRAVLRGETSSQWQSSLYYRYWNNGGHHCAAHYGVRTARHKLVYYYSRPMDSESETSPALDPYWELYDLATDPQELHNIHAQPGTEAITRELMAELERLQRKYGDEAVHASA